MATRYLRRNAKRSALCFLGISGFYEARLRHTIEYPVAALNRPFALTERMIVVGCFGQRGEIGRFRNREFVHGLVKVNQRSSRDAVSTKAEINLVQVKLKNLVFA